MPAGYERRHPSERDRRDFLRVNEQIRISPVRLIGVNGEQLGIVPTSEALARAREAQLDLVEVAPHERPPVCRIMDYGKFRYQQSHKQKKAKVHHPKVKEIRLRPKTSKHDLEIKINQARRFLEHKDKVILWVQFRGREKEHIEEGRKVLDAALSQLEDLGRIERAPTQEGANRLVVTLVPKS